jgi:hypothetical protein
MSSTAARLREAIEYFQAPLKQLTSHVEAGDSASSMRIIEDLVQSMVQSLTRITTVADEEYAANQRRIKMQLKEIKHLQARIQEAAVELSEKTGAGAAKLDTCSHTSTQVIPRANAHAQTKAPQQQPPQHKLSVPSCKIFCLNCAHGSGAVVDSANCSDGSEDEAAPTKASMIRAFIAKSTVDWAQVADDANRATTTQAEFIAKSTVNWAHVYEDEVQATKLSRQPQSHKVLNEMNHGQQHGHQQHQEPRHVSHEAVNVGKGYQYFGDRVKNQPEEKRCPIQARRNDYAAPSRNHHDNGRRLVPNSRRNYIASTVPMVEVKESQSARKGGRDQCRVSVVIKNDPRTMITGTNELTPSTTMKKVAAAPTVDWAKVLEEESNAAMRKAGIEPLRPRPEDTPTISMKEIFAFLVAPAKGHQ